MKAAALTRTGRFLFALAIVALGIETWACARKVGRSLGPHYAVIPALPWLPAIPRVLGGAGLMAVRTRRTTAMVLGSLLVACALILEAPKNGADLFEPLALGSLACLLPGRGDTPELLARAARYLPGLRPVDLIRQLADARGSAPGRSRDRKGADLPVANLALSCVVFGVDHFLALGFIAGLLPGWIPWHVFWVAASPPGCRTSVPDRRRPAQPIESWGSPWAVACG